MAAVAHHTAHAYTPNEAASYGGRDHLVVEADFVSGRLRRSAGDALCKPRAKFWGLMKTDEGRRPSCKRCLELAERYGIEL